MPKSIVEIVVLLAIVFLIFQGFTYEDNLPVPHFSTTTQELVYFETPEGRKSPSFLKKGDKHGEIVWIP